MSDLFPLVGLCLLSFALGVIFQAEQGCPQSNQLPALVRVS